MFTAAVTAPIGECWKHWRNGPVSLFGPSVVLLGTDMAAIGTHRTPTGALVGTVDGPVVPLQPRSAHPPTGFTECVDVLLAGRLEVELELGRGLREAGTAELGVVAGAVVLVLCPGPART